MLSDRFRVAVESKDPAALEQVFSEEVVLRSPVAFKPYVGRAAVLGVLSVVVQVFEDFRYTDQVETGDTAVLAFSARVGGRDLDGIDLLRFAAGGRVLELAVYVRPLSGVAALAEATQRLMPSSS